MKEPGMTAALCVLAVVWGVQAAGIESRYARHTGRDEHTYETHTVLHQVDAEPRSARVVPRPMAHSFKPVITTPTQHGGPYAIEPGSATLILLGTGCLATRRWRRIEPPSR